MANVYSTFDIQLMSSFSGQTIAGAGGVMQVCVAGTYHKATLYDPDNAYAALSNPITLTRGKARFALIQTGSPPTCDVFGTSPVGHWFVRRGCVTGDPVVIPIDGNRREEVAIVPFAVADCTAGTEKDTGFVLPSGAVVKPWPIVVVTTAAGQGSKTITAGLLSSQSGGVAAGFVNGISLTSIATVTTKLATTGTLGSLLSETTTGATAVIGVAYVVGATAVNISYTLTSSATLAEGYVAIPYTLPVA